MNTYRYDEHQRRAWVLDKISRRKSVKQICQEAVISRATLYNWLAEFPDAEAGSPTPPEDGIRSVALAKANTSTEENTLTTALTFEGAERYKMLISTLKKTDPDGSFTKKLVAELVKRYTLTIAQACDIVGIDQAVYGYKPRKPEVDDQLVEDEVLRLIAEEPTRGFVDIYNIIQQTQPDWTRKQLKRVYRERRLYLKRTRNKKGSQKPQNIPLPSIDPVVIIAPTPSKILQEQKVLPPARLQRPDATWTISMAEGSEDGQPIWALFIIDQETNTPLNATNGIGHVTAQDIISFLNLAVRENGKPKKLRLFAKEPFTARDVIRWTWDNKVGLHSLTLGKPENQEEADTIDKMARENILITEETSLSAVQQHTEKWLLAALKPAGI